MTAIREQVLASAATALGAIAGHDFARNPRTEVATAAECPALRMWDGGHELLELLGPGCANYRMTFDVEIFVAGGDVGAALNASYAAAVNALYQWADGQMGTLIVKAQESGLSEPEFFREEGSVLVATATLGFVVDFWTQETDVEQL